MDYIEAILRNIVFEDKEKVIEYKKTSEDFKYYPFWKCFKCGDRFYTLDIQENRKKRVVTCPHCGEKFNVKAFKNGRYSQGTLK